MKVVIGVSTSRFPQGASSKRQSFAPRIVLRKYSYSIFTEHMTYEYSPKKKNNNNNYTMIIQN